MSVLIRDSNGEPGELRMSRAPDPASTSDAWKVGVLDTDLARIAIRRRANEHVSIRRRARTGPDAATALHANQPDVGWHPILIGRDVMHDPRMTKHHGPATFAVPDIAASAFISLQEVEAIFAHRDAGLTATSLVERSSTKDDPANRLECTLTNGTSRGLPQ